MHAHARFVGPDEPLDLVVPVLWDDRDGINACRSRSSLECWRGEFPMPVSKDSGRERSQTVPKMCGAMRTGAYPTRYISFPC